VELAAEINNLHLTAVPADPDASVLIDNPDLQTGENLVNITVTAPSGSKKTYTINAVRAAKQAETKAHEGRLKDLAIEGYVLSPPFSPQRTEYVVYLPYEADHIEVKAVGEDEAAQAVISGNDNLRTDEANIITVAAGLDGPNDRTYTIVAMRAEPFGGLANLPPEETPLAVPVTTITEDSPAKTATIYKVLLALLAIIAIFEAVLLVRKSKKTN
jgi:hypothetical protein